MPAVARVGNLQEARLLLARGEFSEAWQSAVAAIQVRPCHPEAFLFLAEMAGSAGAEELAHLCSQHACRLAPAWKATPQIPRSRKWAARPDWMSLPESITTREAREENRLTVCVIARNEEKFLDRCLGSVRGVAAQLIVVDTGSADSTVEIARRHGAEVYSLPWCDDFSAPRNKALEHATGDWILMLDADEELPADQRASFLMQLHQKVGAAFRLPLVNKGRENEGCSYVPRLFRNVPGAFYQGRIHEQVFPSLLGVTQGWGLRTGLGTAHLLHHGYSPDMVRDRNKIERNLHLLRLAMKENPGDVNLILNLGLELTRSGDSAGGLAQYGEAYRLMSALPSSAVVPELREALLTQLTSRLYEARAHDEVVCVLNSSLAKQGAGLTASLHFALGLSQYELKRYGEAAEQMRRCLATRGRSELTPINTDVLTAAPRRCLALSLAKLGDKAGAEAEFQEGLRDAGRTEVLEMDYARFLVQQGRAVEALQRMGALVMRAPKLAAAWRLGGEIALSRTEFLDSALQWTDEALGHLPEDELLIAQRAEALMLKGRTDEAQPLWEKTCGSGHVSRATAAWILCSAVEACEMPSLRSDTEEMAVSRAFIEWYQKLVSAGARSTLIRLNGRIDLFAGVLPTAARMLRSALAEATKPPV